MPRCHTPRLGDFLLKSKNFSLLCDFHPSRLPEFYHYTINNIDGGQIFGSSSLCCFLRLPFGAFLSGPNKYFVFILENGMASIQPIQNKNMFLVALNGCSFPIEKGQGSDSYQTVDKITMRAFLGGSQNCEMWLLASSGLSVRMEQLGSHWTDIHEIWYLSMFRKYVEDIQVSLKSDKNNGYFKWRPMYTDVHYVFAQFFLEWEMFQRQVEKFELFPRKSCHSWDDNMAHAHCKLDTSGYKHTHKVCKFAFPL